MPDPDFDRVAELFTRAVQLEPTERTRFLESSCGDDARLRREVETMLRFDDVETPDAFTDSRLLEGRRALDRAASELLDGLPGSIAGWRVGRRVARRDGETTVAVENERDGRLAWLVVGDAVATTEVAARIEAEGPSLVALRHEGLVPVLEVGLVDAREGRKPYRVTAVPPGRSVWRYLSDHRPETPERLELVARVADAIAAAHRAGFRHGQLEPRAVHVSEAGVPVVTGLGGAHWTGADLAEPTARALAHKAPEQARRDREEIGNRTDVHALGLLLHDVVAGRPALDVYGRRTREALRIVCEEEPPPLSRAGLVVPAAIEETARRALAKRPSDRFATADAFADALRRAARASGRPSRRVVVRVLLAAAAIGAGLAVAL